MRNRLSVFHTELSFCENRNSIMKAPRNDGMRVYPNRAMRVNLFCASDTFSWNASAKRASAEFPGLTTSV